MKLYIILTKNFKYIDVCDSKIKAEKLVEELYLSLQSIGVTEEKYRIVEKIFR